VAEIPVVQKPRSRAAPIILLLILLVVIACAWYWWSGRPPATPATTAPQTGSITVTRMLEAA
jgi:hypothetical protein